MIIVKVPHHLARGRCILCLPIPSDPIVVTCAHCHDPSPSRVPPSSPSRSPVAHLVRGVVPEGAAVVGEAPAEAAAPERAQQQALPVQHQHLLLQAHDLPHRAPRQLCGRGPRSDTHTNVHTNVQKIYTLMYTLLYTVMYR